MAAVDLYANIPLYFEKNKGQAGDDIKYLTKGPGHALYLGEEGALLVLSRALESRTIRMSCRNSNPHPVIEGIDEQECLVNYFIGDEPEGWNTEVKTFGSVRYRDIYEGIDLVYYGNGGKLEYDFIVSPGARPEGILIDFEGVDEIIDMGDLVLRAGEEEVTLHKPIAYQELDGKRVEVYCRYVADGNVARFELGDYNRGLQLVIDPVLEFSTYLGGSGVDTGYTVAIDGEDNIYVSGNTASTNFPGTTGSQIQAVHGGATYDVFVTKINSTGTQILYSTYLGASGNDEAFSIALDRHGNTYVTGRTDSSNFPGTTGSQIQSVYGGGAYDGFVTKINSTGTQILYSTYLGGNADDYPMSIAVDKDGNAYVAGYTRSTNFLGTTGSQIQASIGGAYDGFVTKINSTGTQILYSTYLGGSSDDSGRSIAVDKDGNVYVTGGTRSTNFPGTTGSQIQAVYGGGTNDCFVTKINSTGTQILYSTYLGGSDEDYSYSMAVDNNGNAYVTGYTHSTNFPGTTGSQIQSVYGGGANDGFVTKINSTGTQILYSTYLGGSGEDRSRLIRVDKDGNAYVTGETASTNFPGTKTSSIISNSSMQPTTGGGIDAFVAKINTGGTRLLYSTYLGGSGDDYGRGIAIDSKGNVVVAGYTTSTNLPGTKHTMLRNTGGIQTTLNGTQDAFIAKINEQVIKARGLDVSYILGDGEDEEA